MEGIHCKSGSSLGENNDEESFLVVVFLVCSGTHCARPTSLGRDGTVASCSRDVFEMPITLRSHDSRTRRCSRASCELCASPCPLWSYSRFSERFAHAFSMRYSDSDIYIEESDEERSKTSACPFCPMSMRWVSVQRLPLFKKKTKIYPSPSNLLLLLAAGSSSRQAPQCHTTGPASRC